MPKTLPTDVCVRAGLWLDGRVVKRRRSQTVRPGASWNEELAFQLPTPSGASTERQLPGPQQSAQLDVCLVAARARRRSDAQADVLGQVSAQFLLNLPASS